MAILNILAMLLITSAIDHIELRRLILNSAQGNKTLQTRFLVKDGEGPLTYLIVFSSTICGVIFIVHIFSYRITFIVACIACFFGQLISITQMMPVQQSVFTWSLAVAVGGAVSYALPLYRVWQFSSVKLKIGVAVVSYTLNHYACEVLMPYGIWRQFFKDPLV